MVFLFAGISVSGAEKYQYTDALSLNVFNKLLVTENPWQRLDVGKYPGMTGGEKGQAKNCTGLAVAFTTDSPVVGVRTTLVRRADGQISPALSVRGFDLYARVGGKWIWAGSKWTEDRIGEPQTLFLLNNAEGMKDYILYLPMVSEISSLEVVTKNGSVIRSAENPFCGRIALFGSSFTQGAGVSRSGMAYAAQLARMTGYNFINMGFSGNSKLQPYFADALIEADVDAYVFDGFSNPSAAQIRERLFPFIEKFQAAKPGVPLIFMKTIHREKRFCDTKAEKSEQTRMDVADSLMRIAVKKYDNVYWVTTTNATSPEHDTTTDGTHPNDIGYKLWAESVAKPISKILRRYGIK